MALGAIAALEAAGKTPGKDVLIVSIDGEKDGVQAIVDGKIGAICGCSPLFGPKAFATMADYAAGKTIPPFIKNDDDFYDAANAKEKIRVRLLNCPHRAPSPPVAGRASRSHPMTSIRRKNQ